MKGKFINTETKEDIEITKEKIRRLRERNKKLPEVFDKGCFDGGKRR